MFTLTVTLYDEDNPPIVERHVHLSREAADTLLARREAQYRGSGWDVLRIDGKRFEAATDYDRTTDIYRIIVNAVIKEA